jgi:16S rRNA (adenine1518-N6/adenine1519-N6)-dimethyltransferase
MNPKLLLEKHDLQPKKSLGQNFLHDPHVLEKIVSVAEVGPDDRVLEIGPGTGLLTAHLADIASEVVAVELDTRLKPILDAQFAAHPNVRVIWDDILNVNVDSLFEGRDYIVVANVPYYITSAILKHLLEREHKPRRIILTVQLEVAERVAARPNDMSLLAVSVQFFGRPHMAGKLNPAVFWPRPDVESALLRIDVFPTPPVDVPDVKTFFRVARAGFGQKRKQLRNSLGSGLQLNAEQLAAVSAASGVDLTRRAETLTLEEWAALTRAVVADGSRL